MSQTTAEAKLAKLLVSFMISFSLLTAFASEHGSDDGQTRAVGIYNLDNNDLALKGYDPVAYFPEGGSVATIGDKNISIDLHGVIYNFANTTNMKTFSDDPFKYEPTYGGWSALGMTRGKTDDIDANHFVVNGDRLHLFKSAAEVAKWNKRPAKLEKRADNKWKNMSGETPRP